MESHIKTLEDRDLEYVQKYEMLLQAKSQQDNILMELTSRKNELENTMVNLRTELELEKSSKVMNCHFAIIDKLFHLMLSIIKFCFL